MFVLQAGVAAIFLFALHQFLLGHGNPMGADVITGAMAFLLVIVVGLTKDKLV
jgi:hypothetical protein